jgi:hypothetical protein
VAAETAREAQSPVEDDLARPEEDWDSLDDARWIEEAFAWQLHYGLLLAFAFSICLWGLLALLAANLL